jgi:hypothetical protein
MADWARLATHRCLADVSRGKKKPDQFRVSPFQQVVHQQPQSLYTIRSIHTLSYRVSNVRLVTTQRCTTDNLEAVESETLISVWAHIITVSRRP